MKTQIKRLCACGCGGITKTGRRWVNGHNKPPGGQIPWNKGMKGIKQHSQKTKQKMSLTRQGKNNPFYGKHHTKESKLKIAITKIKIDPNGEYCGAWDDKEYKKDLRKDYCENRDCEGHYKKLDNHHINLNKHDCRPFNIMTLCVSCSASLHWKLGRGTNHKDYLTIIRKDRITYIHKETRKKITIWRII